jgi:hypothetical protein
MAPAGDQEKALDDLITSTLALIARFEASLTAKDTTTTTAKVADAPNPLHIMDDAARLLKAHVTKVSLLAINKPFTPSAVTSVLRELAGTCLPAMMSAVQICMQDKSTWTAFMAKEASLRVRRVFKEMDCLLQEVRNIARGDGEALGGKRDSLGSTGVVWEACDALIELKKLGVAGLAVQKAEQWRDTIKDAITELQEWTEGEDTDTEGNRDALLDSDDEGVDGDADSFDDIFNAANSMPADRPELKELVEESIEKLKKVGILYNALIKRRLKTFELVTMDAAAKYKTSAEQLDAIVATLRTIPHLVDELASSFYDLDEAQAKEVLAKCVSKALDTAATAELSYDGQEDEFSAWSLKWRDAVS